MRPELPQSATGLSGDRAAIDAKLKQAVVCALTRKPLNDQIF